LCSPGKIEDFNGNKQQASERLGQKAHKVEVKGKGVVAAQREPTTVTFPPETFRRSFIFSTTSIMVGIDSYIPFMVLIDA
jgi:hypothetical protein